MRRGDPSQAQKIGRAQHRHDARNHPEGDVAVRLLQYDAEQDRARRPVTRASTVL